MGNKPLKWEDELFTGLFNSILWCISVSNQYHNKLENHGHQKEPNII